MTGPFPELDELRTLLDALCEDSIGAEQMRRLEELLLTSPEAEAYYVQYMSHYADLSRHFAEQPAVLPLRPAGPQTPAAADPAVQPLPRPAGGIRRTVLSRGALALAGLAAGLLLAVFLGRTQPPGSGLPVEPAAEPSDNSVAVLLQAPSARWGETDLPTRPGSPLPPGLLRLKSGFAHIEFYSGATVILEGPTDLHLVSPMEAVCARGKLRATVPPQAQGFTIRLPHLDLVDRGTEFGLHVDGSTRTEVHVFRGKVDLYDAGTHQAETTRKQLTEGEGVRLDRPGQARAIASDPTAFRTAQDLARRLQEETRRRHQEWQACRDAVRQDPSLRLYYSFEPEQSWDRTLLDQSGLRQQPQDGVIVGCSWGTGRWAGKRGLEFRRISDRVRFHVPGEFNALTLLAWVRVDSLPNLFNSLMMTDDWEALAPHWHIRNDGRISLGVKNSDKKQGVNYTTPRIFTPDRLGQWVQLAVVYDRQDNTVTQYVDGQVVKQEPLQFDISLRLGDAELGNWTIVNRTEKHPVRYLSGAMDEFLLFARALGGPEIEQLYARGRPPM